MRRVRNLLHRYERTLGDGNPLVAQARLHLVVPLALVAAVTLLLVGTVLPQGRQPHPALSLIESRPISQSYERILNEYRRFKLPVPKDHLKSYSLRQALFKRRLLQVARLTPLRNCRWEEYYRHRIAQVACDGPRLESGALATLFWMTLGVSLLMLVVWFYVQIRDSWMLPRWNPDLWYTPVYATTMFLIACGPFILAESYFRSASADYVVPPDRWFPVGPGLLLMILAVLQLTAIAIAVIERRPNPAHFLGVVAVSAVIGVGVYTTLQVRSYGHAFAVGWVGLIEVAALGAFLWWRKFVPASPSGPSLHRVCELSRLLPVAWLLVVLQRIIEAEEVGGWLLGSGLTLAGYLLVTGHLMSSHAGELGLRWLGLRPRRGR